MALEVFQLVFSDLLEMKNALPPFLCKQYECTAGAKQWKETKASTSFQLFRTIDQGVMDKRFLIRWWLITTCLSRFFSFFVAEISIPVMLNVIIF